LKFVLFEILWFCRQFIHRRVVFFKCHVPEEHRIRDYVCRPPPGNTRLYCTMIRRDDDDSPAAGCHGADGVIDPIDPAAAAASATGGSGGGGVGFTLYLEFLGGLIPLLKVSTLSPFSYLAICRRNFICALFTTGCYSISFFLQGKPTSRIRPEFVIYDPRKNANNETNKVQPLLNKNSEHFLAPPQPSGSKFQQLLSPVLFLFFSFFVCFWANRRRRKYSDYSSVNFFQGLRRKFRRHRPDDDSDSETDDSCVSTPRLQRKFGGKKQLNNQSVNLPISGDVSESKTNSQEVWNHPEFNIKLMDVNDDIFVQIWAAIDAGRSGVQHLGNSIQNHRNGSFPSVASRSDYVQDVAVASPAASNDPGRGGFTRFFTWT
jgi:hypothetical protein